MKYKEINIPDKELLEKRLKNFMAEILQMLNVISVHEITHFYSMV